MPYIGMFLLSLLISPVSDYFVNSGRITIGTGRKIFNTIGHWIPAACFVGLGFVTREHTESAVALLVVCVTVNSGIIAGFHINNLDISPNFAGTLMGITNTLANLVSIVAPLYVGYIVTDNVSGLIRLQIC